MIPVLAALHAQKEALETLPKPEIRHLVSRTMNLAKSPHSHARWCGINVMRVLSDSPAILASDGTIFVAQLLKLVETASSKTDTKILRSAVDALNAVCDNIRGKPTLTREILTPRLPAIISAYMEKLPLAPQTLVKSLTKLALHHPTTFRPFGNKLRARLIDMVVSDAYRSFPESLRAAIGAALATLPAIEKTEPETTWANDVHTLLAETTLVLAIYREFLAVSEDSDAQDLFKRAPVAREGAQPWFPSLEVDVNHYASLYAISQRVATLTGLLEAYLTTETAFSVKVPLGSVLLVAELACAINPRFIPFNSDIRDENLQKIIASTAQNNHHSSVRLLAALPAKYGGDMVPHLNGVLAFLETLIPFRNRRIHRQELLANENFVCDLLACVKTYLSLVRTYNDASQLLRFVEVALYLVEPRDRTSSEPPKPPQNEQKTGKKNKKRKNHSAVPLADLLSHQHLFLEAISSSTLASVRLFINTVITRVSLPPTQHFKIMRYLVVEAVHARKYNNDREVPSELKQLLLSLVLFPGAEKVSVLPIISSIMGDDPLLSVFNNPRFPPLPVRPQNQELEVEEEELEDEEDEHEDLPLPKRQKTDSFAEPGPSGDAQTVPEPMEVEIEKEAELKTDQNDLENAEVISFASSIPKVAPQIAEVVPETAPAAPMEPLEPPKIEPEEDSDFEMPQIDVDGDSDDE